MIECVGELLRELGRDLSARRDQRMSGGCPLTARFGEDADRWAHQFLSHRLPDLLPGVSIISEEDPAGRCGARPDRYWLIDPIDGTASYCAGYDGFVCQVALMVEGGPALGAVYAPVFDELFLAERSYGASRNGIRLAVAPSQSRCVLIDNYPEPRGTAARIYRELGSTGYVESGSIGLKLCRVADGTADVFFKDVTVRDWDVAPAALIVHEAGGAFCSATAEPYRYNGDYEKLGLISATTEDLAMRVAALLPEVQSREERKPLP